MNLVLTNQITSDLISNCGTALYYLICCYQDQYTKIVENFINEQTDPSVAQRLAAEFTALLDVILNADRVNKMKFRDNFEKFVVKIQGFLMVK